MYQNITAFHSYRRCSKLWLTGKTIENALLTTPHLGSASKGRDSMYLLGPPCAGLVVTSVLREGGLSNSHGFGGFLDGGNIKENFSFLGQFSCRPL